MRFELRSDRLVKGGSVSPNQRTSVTNADGSYWVYTYDALGQVTGGGKRWSDGTPVAGQQFEYAFDDIGNRQWTKAGQDLDSGEPHQAQYWNNALNQITFRQVPGFAGLGGTASTDATVSLNYRRAVRQGEYWWAEAVVTNANGPAWMPLEVVGAISNATSADIVTNLTGHALLPRASQQFFYDADGNLTSDSLWTNSWNAENRRVTIESVAGVPTAAKRRVQWTHLGDGRWIERIVSTNNGSGYFPAFTNRYVWDGQVLLAVLDHTNGLVMSFMRGVDLSGSQQGAGGVGGLLCLTSHLSPPTSHFVSYDGNGNVTALVDAATGEESARYEYGPFGEAIRMTGPMAKLNPLRFSTQYADDVTGDVKYLFRDYGVSEGRWRSRDPIGERGGLNLYGFVKNRPVDLFDPFGLYIYPSDPGGCPPGTGPNPNCNIMTPGWRSKSYWVPSECPCIPIPTAPPPPTPTPTPTPQPPPSSGSRSFDLETIENGKACSSVCYCKPTDFYRAGSGQADWDHYQLKDATFSSWSCTCNYTVISGPSAGTAYSQKGGFGKICGLCWN